MTVGFAVMKRAPRFAAFRFFLAQLARLTLLLLAIGHAPANALTQPKWNDLGPARQQALKPLAGEWDKLDNLRKKKWITVADRYPGMKPEEQKRIQGRMADWAKLTPDQRSRARETFRKSKALPPDQKKEAWQKYQTLPDVQKQQLAASADAKKPAKQKQRQRELEGKVGKPTQTVKSRPPAEGASPGIAGAPKAIPLPVAAPAN